MTQFMKDRLAIKNGTALPKVKPMKPLKKESPKMTVVKQELKKLYTIILSNRPVCEIKSPVCTKKATCCHHTQGRGKNEILDPKKMMASCDPCNSYVEQHHAWAEKKGFKISRHKKG
jgi:hypothetical protein